MSEELKVGCARPTGGPVGQAQQDEQEKKPLAKKEESTMVMVGRKAPDFTAPGYHGGRFVEIKLSEYLGKWTLLCFYPGDFTFV